MAMLEREEIGRSLTGAWQLFLNRPDAMRFFDVSVGGFWRSFGAIGLIVPAYAIVAIAEQQVLLSDSLPDESFAEGAFVLDKALALSVDWITLPILLALLAGPLGISRTYPAFVVARNWGAVIAILPFAAIDFLFALGLLNADIVGVLSAAMLFVILRYNFIIARRALGVGTGFALTLTIADFVLSLAIAQSVDWLVGI
jgi:hypothetical protein